MRSVIRVSGEAPHPLQGLAEQARDVHLGDAQARADLLLREVREEPQVDDLALAAIEPGESWLQVGPALRERELVPSRRQVVLERDDARPSPPPTTSSSLTPARVARAPMSASRPVSARASAARRRRRPRSSCTGSGNRRHDDRSRRWWLISPATSVACVGRERDAPARLEALDRLEQPHDSLLDEVVDLIAVHSVTAGDTSHEPQVLGQELLQRVAIVVLAHGGDEAGVARPDRIAARPAGVVVRAAGIRRRPVPSVIAFLSLPPPFSAVPRRSGPTSTLRGFFCVAMDAASAVCVVPLSFSAC